MNIGVLTFYTSNDNYGQQLQAYALQKKLKQSGHIPYLVRYDVTYSKPKNIKRKILKLFNPVKVCRYVRKKMCRVSFAKNDTYKRRFEEFRKRYLNMYPVEYKTTESIYDNPPKLDAYIVGSDQVWNWENGCKSFEDYVKVFFLGFGSTESMRVAYAASWGGKIPDETQAAFIKQYLEKFDVVTVREEEGIRTCSKCGRSDAVLVPDPTLLLGPDDYRKIYKNEEIGIPQNRYVLFYYLNNGGAFDISYLYEWACRKGLEVEYVSGNGQYDNYRKNYATIPEWIYLIENAEYVITNSYHCCIFSLLFGKKFGVIPLTGKNMGMNSRFESLFKMCSVAPRYINGNDYSVLEAEVEDIHIDYFSSDGVLNSLIRNECIQKGQ